MSGRVVMLSGGVGGAKLVQGMSQVVPDEALTVIVNTGDDFQHMGLWISPDIDSVLYALSGLEDPERGWGRRGETWTFMGALEALGGPSWFRLGDGDLAMHVERTRRRSAGEGLGAITRQFALALGIGAEIVPMSDDPAPTLVQTDEGVLGFQDYFVNRRCEPRVRSFRFPDSQRVTAHERALAALHDPLLRAVIIGPSNPFVSIDPILAVPGLRTALENVRAPIVAVTPIVDGRAIKGPAAKMLAELGLPVTGGAVGRHYAGLIDGFVLDLADMQASEAAPAGVRLFHLDTVMRDRPARRRLAAQVLAIADGLPGRGTRPRVPRS